MGDKKQVLRDRVILKRESLSGAEVRLWNRLVQARVLHFPPYLVSKSVALYSSIGKEVATQEIRDHALRSGKKLYYPRLEKGERVSFIRVRSVEELRPGKYGILEPTGSEVTTRLDQDGLVVFVPGLAFDLEGNRLGRGKGWYDRALQGLEDGVRFVALAYEFQIVKRLSVEAWDRKVHHIVTEKRTIDCGGNISSWSAGGSLSSITKGDKPS